MSLSGRRLSALIAGLSAVLSGVSSAGAQQAEPYKGRTVTIVVGSSTGGGYDAYARLLARRIGAHLPGEPAVIVQNMPGGGSLTAVRYLDASAARDGTVMTTFNPGLITESILAGSDAKTRFTDVAWIGSVTGDVRICYVGAQSGIRGWDDLARPSGVTFGATGLNSLSYNDIAMLRGLFGRNIRPVLGYPGRTEVHMAIERGEIDGECGSSAGIPEAMWTSGKLRVVLRMSPERPAEIAASVPYVGEHASTDEQRNVLELMTAANRLGRPVIVSRQVPPDRLAILRAAFEATMRDKEFLELAARQALPVGPTPGPAAEEIVASLYKAAPETVSRARALLR